MKFDLNFEKLNIKLSEMKGKITAKQPELKKIVEKLKNDPKVLIAGGAVAIGLIGGGAFLAAKPNDAEQPIIQPTSSSVSVDSSSIAMVEEEPTVSMEEAFSTIAEIPVIPLEERPIFTTVIIKTSEEEEVKATFYREPKIEEYEDVVVYGHDIATNSMVFVMYDERFSTPTETYDELSGEKIIPMNIAPVMKARLIDFLLAGTVDNYVKVLRFYDEDNIYETENRKYQMTPTQLYDYVDDLGAQFGYGPVARFNTYGEEVNQLVK